MNKVGPSEKEGEWVKIEILQLEGEMWKFT